jgi:cytochrome c biogenesis protein CcmG, thiol:disulfide interchange protein DsbE
MKKYLIFILLTAISAGLYSQTSLPGLSLKSTDGSEIRLSELVSFNKPIIISFWATWCSPCLEEFEAIADLYDDWKKETDFLLVAINIDDSRSTSKVKSLAAGKEWPFIVLLDFNQEVKRAMNVSDIPFCFIFGKNGKLAYKHMGYIPGNENILLKELKKAAGEKE